MPLKRAAKLYKHAKKRNSRAVFTDHIYIHHKKSHCYVCIYERVNKGFDRKSQFKLHNLNTCCSKVHTAGTISNH